VRTIDAPTSPRIPIFLKAAFWQHSQDNWKFRAPHRGQSLPLLLSQAIATALFLAPKANTLAPGCRRA
jgi:hypothetical protein